MVCILMSTYNGEKYLEEQLESLVRQEGVEVRILVRDDGSKDATCVILNKWQEKGLLTWYTGENKGPAQSFMDLLYNAPEADYYAFCDQDDVWLPNKLRIAIDKLTSHEKELALYISTTKLVDQNLNFIGLDCNKYNYTFGESFLRNPATGCTMVFNRKLYEKVISYKPSYIYMHDGWVYKICLMLNGFLYHDSESYILYRQHLHNVVGGRKSFIKRWKRRYNIFMKKHVGIRFLTNHELYNGYSNIIPESNKKMIEECLYYKESLINKIKFIKNPLINTPHKITKIYFIIACMINKY